MTPPAAAQLARDSSTAWVVAAGSEAESYLRALQVAGLVESASWSQRPFSTAALRRMTAGASAHPWSASLAVANTRSRWISPVAVQGTAILNSGFAYGMNDGPVWAGRGLTASALGGVQGAVGPLAFTLVPQVFGAQNAAFPILPNGMTGAAAFANVYSTGIDLPQRFGDRPYGQVDPGNSNVTLSLFRTVVGVSTANEAWGPAVENPFLLGTNAAGFLHFFLGTDGPIEIGPVLGSLRVIAGRLDQSAYSPVLGEPRRLLTGFVATLGTRALPGLEVGVARLFESTWPDSGLGIGGVIQPLLRNPFKANLSASNGGGAGLPDNQLASVFARWSLPDSRVAVYGELGREDNAYDARDLILEPDHDLSYLVGLERAWVRSTDHLVVFRAELLNSSISHLANVRQEAPPYVHTPVRQGHTQRGQLLGAPSGFGGGGALVQVNWYDPSGRRGIAWRRIAVDPTPLVAKRDVMHALTADWLLFRRRIDLQPEATLVYDLNRIGGSDAVNLRTALTGTLHW
jgi:hypothetical protein